MKTFLTAIVGLAVIMSSTPAMAYVVEITTSIELGNLADQDKLRDAVESAIADILINAIAFSPTVVTVQNARVVGGPDLPSAADRGRRRRKDPGDHLDGRSRAHRFRRGGKTGGLVKVAQQTHMSPYHFARLFKTVTGVSPHRFVLH